MELRNRYDGLDPAVIRPVRFHARRLAAAGGIPGAELEDLEQELMLDLLRRLSRFDGRRSSLATFAERVTRNRAATLVESAGAAKRQASGAAVPLHGHAHRSPDEPPLADVLASEDALWPETLAAFEERAGLRHDLGRLFRELSDDLRDACLRLREDSVAEAIALPGRTRGSVYHALARLRAAARAAGLEIYLARRPTDAGASR
jgi:RNA polymerase sigma-70 factor, ECF subfamily